MKRPTKTQQVDASRRLLAIIQDAAVKPALCAWNIAAELDGPFLYKVVITCPSYAVRHKSFELTVLCAPAQEYRVETWDMVGPRSATLKKIENEIAEMAKEIERYVCCLDFEVGLVVHHNGECVSRWGASELCWVTWTSLLANRCARWEHYRRGEAPGFFLYGR